MHNAHVIKLCRWQCWIAAEDGRQVAQFFWATQERIERKSAQDWKQEITMEQSLEQRIETVQKAIRSDEEELNFADGQAHYNLLREINENYTKLHQLNIALKSEQDKS